MSKGEGLKIGIKFTEDLIGDITGLNPPIGYTAGTNDLAQGKTVTVGNASYGAGSNAVDGNNNTYWGTYSTFPWWIRVDLNEVKKTAGFYILQSNASYRAKDYIVLGSNDGTNFTEISTGQLANISEQTILYNSSDYRYIRINFTSYWTSSRAYIYTLKILEAVPAGNEQAFLITGKQYNYVHGSLLDKEYKLTKVEPYPIKILHNVNLNSGALSQLQNTVDGLILEQGYVSNGSAIFNLGLIEEKSRLMFSQEIPEGTNLTVETSNDGENWTTKQNNDSLNIGNIYVKVNLSTTNSLLTPTLMGIWLEELVIPRNKILLTFDWWGRFNNAEDKIKVLYNVMKGNLTGAGGAIESFEIEFTPEDLIQTPNPNEEELIKAYPYEIITDLKDITFTNGYPQETIKAYPYSIVLNLIDVGEINP